MADPPPPQSPASCTPLEQEVLDEYARLLSNLQKVLQSHHQSSDINPSHHESLPTWITGNSVLTRPFLPAALQPIRIPRRPPYCRSPGRIEVIGEEDESGVYIVEGECV